MSYVDITVSPGMCLTTIIFGTSGRLSVCKVTLVLWFLTVVLRVVTDRGYSKWTGGCTSVMERTVHWV